METGLRARYLNGELLLGENGSGLEVCVVPKGTTVTLENLFFKNPTKRQLMADENQIRFIEELVKIYACYFFECQFILKINEKVIYKNDPQRSRAENLVLSFNELSGCELKMTEGMLDSKLQVGILHTKPNDAYPSKTVISFINNRLVKNAELNKTINGTYRDSAMAISKSNFGFFAFVSLKVNPKLIDFNVSANKFDVRMINEKDSMKYIDSLLSDQLRSAINVKQYTQSAVKFNYFNSKDLSRPSFGNEGSDAQNKKFHVRADPSTVTLDLIYKS
jgi:DNA mismatch repair ATPase MutL